nr:RHS repeat domain-containing protein [Paenibacillus fonticola]
MVQYRYNEAGDLSAVTDALGQTTLFHYDQHLMVKMTDATATASIGVTTARLRARGAFIHGAMTGYWKGESLIWTVTMRWRTARGI